LSFVKDSLNSINYHPSMSDSFFPSCLCYKSLLYCLVIMTKKWNHVLVIKIVDLMV